MSSDSPGPITLSDILGQDAAVTLLRSAVEAGRVPSALLFFGPDGVGKRTEALAFARTQLTTNEFMGLWRVIDVSGDGLCKNWRYYEHGILDDDNNDPAHYGTPWNDVIATLPGAVNVVNGVFIGSEGENPDFYNDILPHGPNAFSMHAEGFWEFGDTVKDKVMREVSVRIPGTFD